MTTFLSGYGDSIVHRRVSGEWEQTVLMKVFTKQVRERARALDLPLAEVARRAGLSERRFGHHATGRSEPDLASLLRIAEALNCTPNELLGVEDATKVSDKLSQLQRQVQAVCRVLDERSLRLLLAVATTLLQEQQSKS